MAAAAQGLENGTVLAVYRENVYALVCSGFHDQVAGSNECFFIGQGDVFTGLDRGQNGLQACIADDGAEDGIDRAIRSGCYEAFFATQYVTGCSQLLLQLMGCLFIRQDGKIRLKTTYLLGHELCIVPCGKNAYVQGIRIGCDDF